MKTYEEHWLEQFQAEHVMLKNRRNKDRVILRTPSIDYCFSPEGWEKFKEKINQV